MTVVNLTVAETALGGAEGAARGRVTVDYVAGSSGFVNIEGSTVTLPKTVNVPFADGALAEVLDLEPTNGECAARITIKSVITGQVLRRYVAIPAAGPVAFGDLVDVNPDTFALSQGPTVSDTIRNTLLDGLRLVRVTQAEYDALPTPRPVDVLYVVTN